MILFILVAFVVSCATTQFKKPDPYAHITVESVKKNCQSAENWTVGVLGMPGLVLRFDKCLNIGILLVVATDETTQIEKIRRPSMELLALHYVEYLKRLENQKDEGEKGTYSIKKIKEESGDGWLTYYYTITYKKSTKP